MVINPNLHLQVAGTGVYLPEEIVSNDAFIGKDLFKYDEKERPVEKLQWTHEGISERMGIKERRKASEEETPSFMGYHAARMALDKSGVSVDSLVGIIFATLTEEVNFPNAAAKVGGSLGARNCFAMDIGNACVGFVDGLIQANNSVLRRPGNYLVIAGERLTPFIDPTDYNSPLFGDGAGAAVLTPTIFSEGIVGYDSMCNPNDGNLRALFRGEKYLRMPNGGKVLEEAVRSMVESAAVAKNYAGWDKADVYVPHQANLRIINGIIKRSPGVTVFNNIARYGNMSAATCAIALHEALQEKVITEGKRVIVTSFGAGFSRASVAMQF